MAVTERTLLQMLTRESILVSSERGSLVFKQRKMGVSELADAAASSHRDAISLHNCASPLAHTFLTSSRSSSR